MSRSTRLVVALTAAAALWLGAHQLRSGAVAARAAWPKTAGTMLLPPPGSARALSLGYRELLADITWARALVYFGSNWGGEGDLSHLEQLIDLIIELDPRFEPVYEWAAYSVVYQHGTATQEEFQTSMRYLERAMQEFPDDYKYFWIAGTRSYFDLWSEDEEVRRGYRERGAELIEQAMQKPNAPPDLARTAANMRSKLGQHQRALDNLRQMILITDTPHAREKLLERMRVEDPDLADELEAAWAALHAEWQKHGRVLPLDLYILLGPDPDEVIDFRRLTTPQDLFGATDAERVADDSAGGAGDERAGVEDSEASEEADAAAEDSARGQPIRPR